MRKNKNSIAQGTCFDDGCHLPIDKYQFDTYIYKYARVMPLKQEQMKFIYIYQNPKNEMQKKMKR